MRLRQAAVELFQQNGFGRATAAEIAARAGVTERTCFRYFTDKREVLFDGQAEFLVALTGSIANAPAEMKPLDILFSAFRSVTPIVEANRAFSQPRQRVISATPALEERELAKLESLAERLAEALRDRDVAGLQAALVTRAAVSAFAQAINLWLEDGARPFSKCLDLAEHVLRDVL